MGYYPIFLDLADRPCLVVGGGPVAEHKVESLLAAGARITVVSPIVTARLAAWAAEGRIDHRARPYHADDLAGSGIAFVATDDARVTAAVSADSRTRGVWVNAADEPARCDFILPSVIRRGRLVVAVSTGGASPAAARAIREELEAYLGERHARLVDLAAAARAALRDRSISVSPERWRRALADGRVRRLIAARRYRRAGRRLARSLEST
ncbi:MAG TPA: bifunctional precorrin-2 dehydrogenase/sirohydrochlorin ferrochelatase [Methylomirabilota bacterium]